MCSISIRCKATCQRETHLPTGDDVQHSCTRNGSAYLRQRVGEQFRSWKPFPHNQPARYRRIQMAPGNVADRVCHCQEGKAKRQCYPLKSDSQLWKGGTERGTTASPENEPEGPKILCGCTLPK